MSNDLTPAESAKVLAKVRAKIRELRIELKVHRRMESLFSETSNGARVATPGQPEKRKPNAGSKRFAKSTMADAAEVLLGEHGGPMHVKDMLQAMLADGYPLSSPFDTLKGSLYSTLLRLQKAEGRFVRVDRGIFDLPNRETG